MGGGKRIWTAVLALLTIAGLTACGAENGGGVLTGPQVEAERVVVTYWENDRRVVEETDPTVGVVVGVFDDDGGELRIGDHVLVIPEDAVKEPTRFTMGKLSGDLRFGLTATRVRELAVHETHNDVGAGGFERPVYLRISYARTDVQDPTGLEVLWVRHDGTLEAMPTTLEPATKTAVGELRHFSDYLLAMP